MRSSETDGDKNDDGGCRRWNKKKIIPSVWILEMEGKRKGGKIDRIKKQYMISRFIKRMN
jgi:hypothetical protein